MAVNVAGTYRRALARPEALMIATLAAATVALIAAAVIGGRHAQVAKTTANEFAEAYGGSSQAETGKTTSGDLVKGPAVTGKSGAATTGKANSGTTSAPTGGAEPERASSVGATREGVHQDYFEFAIHGPLTFDGVPLNLAEDPVTGVKGYVTYLNRQGGINGLKIRTYIIDDRYTTQGGQQAADRIVKEIKPFVISGTLGIDQIAKVAKAAGAAGIPYFAGGGPEPEFKDVGMFQNLASYDRDADIVIDFICKYGPQYVGGKTAADVRLGTTTLNSENILPVEKRFINEITARKCVKTPVEAAARGTISKPTEQKTYADQGLRLKTAYGGLGANLLIPFQDPVTTSRQVLEWEGQNYKPKWTIADFAHESDTVLDLMHGQWTGMRVMALGCYYHPQGGGDPYNAAKCAALGKAHKDWTSLGHVDYDENAGGGAGGHTSYDYNEESWTADGSGGSAGYQFVYFWVKAMRDIGTDPTREKFVAAMSSYDNYSDLVTGPITFKDSPNTMIGEKQFVLYEAKSNLKWRQVTEITPGLVDHF